MSLKIENYNFKYGSSFALKNINLEFDNNITAIIGPNGSGKSTLLKCIVNINKCSGKLYYDRKEINKHNKDFTRERISYLPQALPNEASITVFEAVLLGLMNSLSLKVSRYQQEKVNQILKDFGISHLARLKVNQLSGGQLQMVLLAQSIIKEPEILLLDEPLNNLDIHKQISLLNTISKLAKEKKIVVVIVMHDINLSARYADNIVVMKDGSVYSSGAPNDVITKEMIRDIYKINGEIYTNKRGNRVIEFVDIV